jgi:hypothetical protein
MNTAELGLGVLKIAALLSYCGGPLFIADILKPRLNMGLAFSMTFLPILLMLLGAFCLGDPTHGPWSSRLVRGGRLGLFIVLGMNLYAIGRFVDGVRVPDQSLHYIGIAVGVAWSVAYLRAARRWTSSAGGQSHPGDRPSTEPIEPS